MTAAYTQREMKHVIDKYDWLRCQIGVESRVQVLVGGRKLLPQTIFHLKAWGRSWEEAQAMLETPK
jgi:hypothetical protein